MNETPLKLMSLGAKATLQSTPYFYTVVSYEGTTETRCFVVFTKNKRAAEGLAARFGMQVSPGYCEVKDIILEKNSMIETSTDLVKRGLYVIE